MERDFFKRYIEEHKDAFENEALPPNMLGNILHNIKQREELKGKRKLTYSWLAIACSLMMLIGTYLFIHQSTEPTTSSPKVQLASTSIKHIDQPLIEKQEAKPIGEHILAKKQKVAFVNDLMAKSYKDIFSGLVDSSSVANRMDALMKADGLTSLNHKLKIELCRTFSNDDNDNVRLAALEVLSKFVHDQYINEQLLESLSKQKDPVVQLELVKIMGTNSNPETTEKLIAMANNPFTVNAVKEQVYYALLTNNN